MVKIKNMRYKLLLFLLIVFGWFSLASVSAQQTEITLDLARTVALANDSSLSAFRAKNMYMASSWEYLAFRAARLPSLTLYATPL